MTQVEYTDIRYSLNAKTLLLRTYYDLEEYEALIALSDAFRQYLQRNRLISDDRKKGYYYLLQFIKRACQIKAGLGIVRLAKSQKEFKRLVKDMDGAGTIFNRGWLEEKMQELGEWVNGGE